MKRLLSSLVIVAAIICGATSAVAADGQWEEASSSDIEGRKLTVYTRSKEGSDVKETRGNGSFAAAPWIIKNVIDDVANYKSFMPYTKESSVLKTGDGFIISYQQLDTPVVENRDYTIKIIDESSEDAAGKIVWKNRWTTSNNSGPAPKSGVTRVQVNEGYWQLEDGKDGGTKVTYYVYTNPGGGLPTFVVNMANTTAVGELFKAVAKQSKDPRYAKTKPTPRTSAKKAPEPTPATISAPAGTTGATK
ncbi:MAG TPA: START domain-containing protein [Myxococcota bacterium]